jgi:antitoxin (DNA-binding transcriptional repressor) of toxin-antitoxin stability system
MSNRPSVSDVARNFTEYVDRVALRGERFVLMRGRRPVAELRPVPKGRTLGDLVDLLSSLPPLTEEEAASFAHDIETARSHTLPTGLRNPWEF